VQPIDPTAPPQAPAPPPLTRLWRGVVSAAVFAFVCYHLVFFLVRNPLDLWKKPIRRWCEGRGLWGPRAERFDRFTRRYAQLVGCEQAFGMFEAPVARRAPFLGVRYEFTDGSSETVPSDEEPPDPAAFFRVGGWQDRKHQTHLLDTEGNDSERDWLPWRAYALAAGRRWRQRHPDEPRTLRRIVLVERRVSFPEPGTDPRAYAEPEQSDLVSFDPDGRLWQ
jgi:hypothetical protein